MKREINIKINYNFDNTISDIMTLNPIEKTKELVEKDMMEEFGWDEGFSGLEVSVIDSE